MTGNSRKWRDAHDAYEIMCDGVIVDGQNFMLADDEGNDIECYESGEPMKVWCSSCVGWEAVRELARMEQEAENNAEDPAATEDPPATKAVPVFMESVESTNLQALGYSSEHRVLFVKFKGGGVYRYDGVEPTVFDEMKASDSFGKFLNQRIKGTYGFEKI